MMWFASFLVLISVSGYFCDNSKEDCFTMQERMCDKNLVPTEFPDTIEDVRKGCRDMQALGNCVLEVRETCEESPYMARTSDVRRVMNYITSICDEDSPVFKVITSNLQCVKRVYESNIQPCGESMSSEEGADTIETYVDQIYEKDPNDLSDCLFRLMDLGCRSIAYGYHCGEDVRRAVEDVITHVEIRYPSPAECTEEHLEELEEFNRVYEDILLEGLALENAIKRRRK